MGESQLSLLSSTLYLPSTLFFFSLSLSVKWCVWGMSWRREEKGVNECLAMGRSSKEERRGGCYSVHITNSLSRDSHGRIGQKKEMREDSSSSQPYSHICFFSCDRYPIRVRGDSEDPFHPIHSYTVYTLQRGERVAFLRGDKGHITHVNNVGEE